MPLAKKQFAVILGARPNFVKAAPFFREAKKHPEFSFTLIHTGQHYDKNMSKIFFDEMDLPKPDIFLELKNEKHSHQMGKMFTSLAKALGNRRYDGVIVFGDVSSTLAGGIAAAKSDAILIHIESGLRSHDRRMPEEMNRVIVDHLSDLLFTTEPSAAQNLRTEGVPSKKIKYVGNIMIESIELFSEKISASKILKQLDLKPKKYVVATVHRAENTKDKGNLKNILLLLAALAKKRTIVLPLHPGTKNDIHHFGFGKLLKNLHVIEPLGYFEFLKLVKESAGVVTDSGGIQEETSHMGIPCATLRDNTERPITLTHGTNRLFKAEPSSTAAIEKHLARKDFKHGRIPYWDANVSKRIFKHLKAQ